MIWFLIGLGNGVALTMAGVQFRRTPWKYLAIATQLLIMEMVAARWGR